MVVDSFVIELQLIIVTLSHAAPLEKAKLLFIHSHHTEFGLICGPP